MDLSLPAEKEYFTIGETSRLTGVKPYILRYWEKQFGALRPARRSSGQRRFTRRDVETIAKIRELLHDRRFTIEGAKKYLRQKEKEKPAQMALSFSESSAAFEALRDVKKELSELLKSLKSTEYQKSGEERAASLRKPIGN